MKTPDFTTRKGAEGVTRWGFFTGVCGCPPHACLLVLLSARVCDCLLLSLGLTVSLAVMFSSFLKSALASFTMRPLEYNSMLL